MKGLIILFILFLISFSTVLSEESKLPSEKQISKFVGTFIDNYNYFIKKDNLEKQEYFKEYADSFLLYEPPTRKFQISVYRQDLDDDAFIALNIEPVISPDRIITLKYDEIIESITGKKTHFSGFQGIMSNCNIGDDSQGTHIGFVIGFKSSEIISDSSDIALKLSKEIYLENKERVRDMRLGSIWSGYINDNIDDNQMFEDILLLRVRSDPEVPDAFRTTLNNRGMTIFDEPYYNVSTIMLYQQIQNRVLIDESYQPEQLEKDIEILNSSVYLEQRFNISTIAMKEEANRRFKEILYITGSIGSIVGSIGTIVSIIVGILAIILSIAFFKVKKKRKKKKVNVEIE
ncbi:MAG: hypothetical protein KAI26_07750 [Nanoarchaeota archaeon]|nr:hypothetical protein [Nanoarchaeota archaeon]